MKVTMEFNPKFGRKVLRLTCGSVEESNLIDELTDEEIMQKCFEHGCIPYCFNNVEIIKED